MIEAEVNELLTIPFCIINLDLKNVIDITNNFLRVISRALFN